MVIFNLSLYDTVSKYVLKVEKATCSSDIVTPIKELVQVQTRLAWTLAFTGLLAVLINAE